VDLRINGFRQHRGVGPRQFDRSRANGRLALRRQRPIPLQCRGPSLAIGRPQVAELQTNLRKAAEWLQEERTAASRLRILWLVALTAGEGADPQIAVRGAAGKVFRLQLLGSHP